MRCNRCVQYCVVCIIASCTACWLPTWVTVIKAALSAYGWLDFSDFSLQRLNFGLLAVLLLHVFIAHIDAFVVNDFETYNFCRNMPINTIIWLLSLYKFPPVCSAYFRLPTASVTAMQEAHIYLNRPRCFVSRFMWTGSFVCISCVECLQC